MVVSSEDKLTQYTGGGTTGPFAIGFPIQESTHLKVTRTVISTGVDTTIVLNAGSDGFTIDTDLTEITTTEAVTTLQRLTIERDVPYTQETDWLENDADAAVVKENAVDKLTQIAQQLKGGVDRSLAFKSTLPPSLAGVLTEAPVDTATIVWDGTTGNMINGPTTTTLTTAAAEAEASAAAALASENAATTQSGIATTQASTATTQAGIATTQAGIAATQVLAATAAVESAPFRDVVFITNADSPYTVTQAQNGTLIAVDTSSGAVTVNLPTISGLSLPFNVTIKKTTGDAAAVTTNAGGSDEVGAAGATSLVTSSIGGATLIGDTDTTPDRWVTSPFGAAAGNMTADLFIDGVDFTAGTSTTVTTTAEAGAEANTWVYFNGVYQEKSEYSVSGTTITFTATIPLTVTSIEVIYGTTLSIGTPSDGTVTAAKLADDAKTEVREIPQNSKSTAYTLVLADAGGHVFHPSADTTARIWTIPANASVPYPVGTAISFVNQNAAGVITISITTDTMRLAGDGTTGSRTLAANGVATALKVTATEWIISGSGLT